MEQKQIGMEYVETNEQVADILTKALPRVKVESALEQLGLVW